MTIGLRDLYYAICTEKETETGVTEEYGTPKKMAEVMTADLSVTTADAPLYADDALSESISEFVSGSLKLGVKELSPEVLAECLNQTVDTNKVIWANKSNDPPYVAIGFRAAKKGGKFRYVWLLKAKFKIPAEKYETKKESITIQTPEVEAVFMARKKDENWKADFIGSPTDTAAATWFTAVPEPAEILPSA